MDIVSEPITKNPPITFETPIINSSTSSMITPSSSAISPATTADSVSTPTPSRYENQKRRDWNTSASTSGTTGLRCRCRCAAGPMFWSSSGIWISLARPRSTTRPVHSSASPTHQRPAPARSGRPGVASMPSSADLERLMRSTEGGRRPTPLEREL
ncbi:protein LIGHT-DEPENDENT SHORT HYPOCOTYLS 1 [Prunus yedoensis var. nudiflora]|uniref:Protein LIGHT-DEPENDENT SHORT HYPOCOTYLS 1 n=1 Tax=Prunus yedoensis var. nudiflora TaxID=2094558 RepID=A0A314YZF2_PRUYE|nr:protein LIGHT-DEPENDENT SHORT HYPOCOTYLS 1 [Prunus yedoensis var. nudiflora]